MKTRLLLLTLCSFSFLCHAQETLSNADIVKLTKLGLPAATIVSKIKNSRTHFDVSIDSLIALKYQGVSGDVVTEMITANASETVTRKDYKDPKTMRKEGFYYYNEHDSSSLVTPINPTMTSGSKIHGMLGTALSQGIVKTKVRSELTGQHANRQIASSTPVFYLYADPKGTLSPNEFVIIKLIEKKNSRELLIGSVGMGGAKMGLDGNELVAFDYEQVTDGIYTIRPKAAMAVGEYCFIYTGAVPNQVYTSKVIDFGVRGQ